MPKRLRASFQPWTAFHFLARFLSARYITFKAASSLGKAPRVLMALRKLIFRLSMAFGRINDLADLRRKLEKWNHALPVPPPQSADRRIAFVPLGGERSQLPLRLVDGGRPVDRFQLLRHTLAFLPVHVVQTSPHQMHDAQLYRGLRIDRLDGLREALQSVHTGDEDILQTPVLQLGQHLQPELRPFVGRGP